MSLNDLGRARRYQLLEAPPADLEKVATLSMRRYTFRPIDDSRGERESFGWINPRKILDWRFSWEDVLVSPYVVLGVRCDRKDFSPVLFRARRDERLGWMKAEKKIEKISRQHRIAVEEELTVKMLKETSPRSSFHRLVWDLNSGVVYIGATGNSICERIQDMFEATFDLKMRPILPALTAAEYIGANGLDAEFHLANAAAAEVE